MAVQTHTAEAGAAAELPAGGGGALDRCDQGKLRIERQQRARHAATIGLLRHPEEFHALPAAAVDVLHLDVEEVDLGVVGDIDDRPHFRI